MKKKLLIEHFIIESSVMKVIPSPIQESVEIDGKKSKVLKVIQGPMGLIEQQTGNDRFYPETEIMSAVEALTPKMNAHTVYGQLDHPKDAGSYKEVSHFVNKLWTENYNGIKYLFGEWAILDTPNGRILNTIYEAGGGIGASYRGYGNVDEQSGHVSEYEMVTVDAVVDPSANTFLIDEQAFKNESQSSKTDSAITEKLNTLQSMIEGLKAESVKKKINEAKTQTAPAKEKPIVLAKEITEERKPSTKITEEPMKIKILKDTNIGETAVTIDQVVSIEDPTQLEGVDKSDYEVMAEKREPPKAGTAEAKLVETQKKLSVTSKKLTDAVESLKQLREYALKVEKVGDTIADGFRETVKENQTRTTALNEMIKYAKTLEGVVDKDLSKFMNNSVTALDEMTAYAHRLEKVVDEELVPYCKKLEKTIDEEFVPYTKRLENIIKEMTDGVKSGEIYENIDKDHIDLIEKVITTYPHLEAMREELLQTRNDEHLEERVQKYLTLFGARTSKSIITGSRVHGKKFVEEKKVPSTGKGERLLDKFNGQHQSSFE